MAFWKSFLALFIIVDVLGNIPIFLSISARMTKTQRQKMLTRAVFASFWLLITFTLLGDFFFKFFGVSLDSFRIAGGILLLVISLKILLVGTWEEKQIDPESSGVVPIAFPLLAGPGAITQVIISTKQYGFLITFISILLVSIINYFVLKKIDSIYKFMGKSGSVVISRLMSIMIAGISVDFIVKGISNTFFSNTKN
ncbi:MAG: MarC family protein [Candidatus Calescibacterium sp.]|nr:MarC family protein [Candidatus Calescibacterium sp.]